MVASTKILMLVGHTEEMAFIGKIQITFGGYKKSTIEKLAIFGSNKASCNGKLIHCTPFFKLRHGSTVHTFGQIEPINTKACAKHLGQYNNINFCLCFGAKQCQLRFHNSKVGQLIGPNYVVLKNGNCHEVLRLNFFLTLPEFSPTIRFHPFIGSGKCEDLITFSVKKSLIVYH